jgi:hypothetical protein
MEMIGAVNQRWELSMFVLVGILDMEVMELGLGKLFDSKEMDDNIGRGSRIIVLGEDTETIVTYVRMEDGKIIDSGPLKSPLNKNKIQVA